MVLAKAKNLEEIAKGEEPTNPISQKDWDDVLKTIRDMPNLERLYGVMGIVPDNDNEKEPILDAEMPINTGGNAFEEASKRVKERLNGSTKISAKKN